MDKPHKKFRVVGQRCAPLDTKRFAGALIAFALHRIIANTIAADQSGSIDAEPTREAS
jgi:hypothetical protein